MASVVRLLVADSGATKTAWGWVTPHSAESLATTQGINPNVQPWSAIESLLQVESPLKSPTHVQFYGAALSEPDYRARMQQLLEGRYPGAAVSVAHDLLGACRAVAAERHAVVAILGTGSSACRYDGRAVVALRGGHGYLLGDEGSGAHLGKLLLSAALQGLVPVAISDALVHEVGMPLVAFRNIVYQDAFPNRMLASLSRFIEENRSELGPLLKESFRAFLQLTILPLLEEQPGEWYAVGSIAAVFEPELRSACQSLQLPAPTAIERHPLDGLLQYHRSRLRDLATHVSG